MVLKVGGFPEYSPSEQQVFDDIVAIVRQAYTKFGYMHIETPAVERNEILFKGGEGASKEIFGLYGMASGIDDLKGYGLNFDLTIPFARYVLDHQGSLIFPFKRFQIQDCWRGERPQRGRYRQFKQADIDAIWRQEGDEVKYLFYDAEIIFLLRQTLETIRTKYIPKRAITTHINNRNLLGGLFSSLTGGDAERMKQLSKLFDMYYKITKDEFNEKLHALVGEDGFAVVSEFLSRGIDQLSKDFVANEEFAQGVRELQEVFAVLRMLGGAVGTMFVYDPFIVRGLDYYTGTVFENLIEGEYELGSVCSGGRYANLTQSIDPGSQQFDGVGGSIGVSRIFTLVQEHITKLSTRKTGIVMIYFTETLPAILRLAEHFKEKNVSVDIYPGPDKLGKQFQYADKHQIKHVVVLGAGEVEKGVYIIKEMASGDQLEKPLPWLEN